VHTIHVMAFAIIETGGKQYKVAEGDILTIEKLKDYKSGDTVIFDKVLLIDDGTKTQVGTPYIEGATITVDLIEEGRGKKLFIQKFKSKSRYKRRLGHRQPFSKISVKGL
jgi:large subunit ribosomal protein L21